MSVLFIAVSRINDRDKLNQYLAGAGGTIDPFGGQVVAFTETADTVEGEPPGGRVVVIKFADRDAAMGWYNSEAYQAVVGLRLAATEGFALVSDAFI
jgi:uncharacterized protein (DUF1330 family)